MRLQLEFFIIIGILLILGLVSMVNLTQKKYDDGLFTKELEFTDTTLTEVNKQSMQGRAFTTYGVRDSGVLTLHQIQYYTKEIESLCANSGVFIDNKLYLTGNVVFNNQEGFSYSSENAIYDKKTKILDITSPFVGKMLQNSLTGDTLRYDVVKQEVLGKQIETVVYTAEK